MKNWGKIRKGIVGFFTTQHGSTYVYGPKTPCKILSTFIHNLQRFSYFCNGRL